MAKSGSSGVNEHNYSINNKNCNVCSVLIDDDGNSMQCELCDQWFCFDCSHMSEEFYNELSHSDLLENLIWYCNGCKKAIPSKRKVLSAITATKSQQSELASCLDSLEKKIEIATSLQVDYRIVEDIRDFRER